jgi:hypothetical protein
VSGNPIRSVAITMAATACITLVACNSDKPDGAGSDSVLATPAFGPLGVPVGVALVEYRGSGIDRWCASFEEGELAVGDTVTLVWPDSGTDAQAVKVTEVRATRAGRCPRLPSDTADAGEDGGRVYELGLAGAADARDSTAAPDWVSAPAIAIRGDVRWGRAANGFYRADLDGDEIPEQARICTSREAAYLSLWTVIDSAAADGPRERQRWRAYQSLGYDVEPSCTEREMDEPPAESDTHGG